MPEYRLGAAELKFAEIIWDEAPVSSGELVRRGAEVLGWKKSTVYTVLKKLCDRGLFANSSGTVTVCVTRAEFEAAQTEEFVSSHFSGSLPAFLAAFTRRRALSDQDISEIRAMIDEMGGDES